VPVRWQAKWLEARRAIDVPRAWRGVETQYLSATLRLVDDLTEHEALEALLEDSKPPMPAAGGQQHDLLTSPFRYYPQRASRFRPLGQHGIWYGSLELRTACAEVAYWRMVFVRDSAPLSTREVRSQHTFFAARVRGAAIDLAAEPWVAARRIWTASDDYSGTQELAAAAVRDGVEVIRYQSVRDHGGINLAVFTPAALSQPAGGIAASKQAWTCLATSRGVKMLRDGHSGEGFALAARWTR